jgi:glutaredoxin 2
MKRPYHLILHADVSTSFKKLQAEKTAVDAVLRELTPLNGIQDSESLRDYFQNMSSKVEVGQIISCIPPAR